MSRHEVAVRRPSAHQHLSRYPGSTYSDGRREPLDISGEGTHQSVDRPALGAPPTIVPTMHQPQRPNCYESAPFGFTDAIDLPREA
jgi:hypothetical protein